MDMFNREDIFNSELYPPYTQVVKGIRNGSDYVSIRSKLEKLKKLIRRTYEEVHDLGIYYRTIDIETIAGMIARIEYLAEEMDDLIDEILEERMLPGRDSETFKHYLRRIKYEVIENIENDTSTLIFDIEHGDEYGIDYYQFEDELLKFVYGTERALKEIENSINGILSRI
jgi:hypothetical protein